MTVKEEHVIVPLEDGQAFSVRRNLSRYSGSSTHFPSSSCCAGAAAVAAENLKRRKLT